MELVEQNLLRYHAMIELVVGLPRQGKSLFSAKTVLELLERNKRWHKRSCIQRKIMSNMPFSPELEAKWPNCIGYWKRLEDVIRMDDVDVVFDEVANLFDARNWLNLSADVKEWLRHHDKMGVEIYSNTQHFEAVDVQFRRLVNRLMVVTKLIGSGRPSATKPPIRWVWGIIWVRQHDPKTYSYQGDTGEKVKSAITLGFPFFIHKALVDIYNTRHKIAGDNELILQHRVKKCLTCNETKIFHV